MTSRSPEKGRKEEQNKKDMLGGWAVKLFSSYLAEMGYANGV